MPVQILDVNLENFRLIPRECRDVLFWEMDHEDPEVHGRFQKEEWFSSTLLEWGPCGKLVAVDDGDDGDGDRGGARTDRGRAGGAGSAGEGAGFAEFAPATLFPRLRRFPAGEAASLVDAVYLAYCYVVDAKRGRGLGTALVRDVARAAVDRGYAAVEALGDRAFDGGWVIPVTFLAANGFVVVRDDERFPLLRLDLRSRESAAARHVAKAIPAAEGAAPTAT
jgi:GNAT superfamily N-acetyltransferase